MNKAVFAILPTLLAVATSSFGAEVITSPADAALAGASVITFEVASSTSPTFVFGAGAFSTTGGNLRIAPYSEAGWPFAGQALHTRFTTAPTRFTVTFDTSTVSAFAMDWVSGEVDFQVKLYSSSEVLLDTLSFPTLGAVATFYGVKGEGIARAEFSTSGAQEWLMIDNFRYVLSPVPEPATATLLALGVAGLLLRRSKQV